jgi:murein DD-endopeptidase MepM/ murein hydrolase activator NlpD
VATSALVGAGVVALVTGALMPADMSDGGRLALVDSDASADVAARAQAASAADRASRSDARTEAGTDIAADDIAPDTYVMPLRDYTVTSNFAPRPNSASRSDGASVTLEAPCGTTYHAVAAGKVILARSSGGNGLTVVIDHGAGIVTTYSHSSVLLVREGQTVQAGQAIGKVGHSGYAFNCALRLELKVDGKVTEPLSWLKARNAAPVPSTAEPLAAQQ